MNRWQGIAVAVVFAGIVFSGCNGGTPSHIQSDTLQGDTIHAVATYPYSTDDDDACVVLRDIWSLAQKYPAASTLMIRIKTSGQNQYGQSTVVDRGERKYFQTLDEVRRYVSADAFAGNNFGGGVWVVGAIEGRE